MILNNWQFTKQSSLNFLPRNFFGFGKSAFGSETFNPALFKKAVPGKFAFASGKLVHA